MTFENPEVRRTMRLTIDANPRDGIGEIERLAKLARDLRTIGFEVTVVGSLDVTARWRVPRPDPDPDPDPEVPEP